MSDLLVASALTGVVFPKLWLEERHRYLLLLVAPSSTQSVVSVHSQKLAGLGETNWDQALSIAQSSTVKAFAQAFRGLADSAEGKAEVTEVYRFLSAVCYVMLAPKHDEGPFVPMMSGSDWRTLLPQDLTSEQTSLLSDLYTATDDPELKARAGDFVWIRKKDHSAGLCALKAYIDSAKRLEAQGEQVYVSPRLERALELAALFSGKRRDYSAEVEAEVAQIVRSRAETHVTTGTFDLIDLLIDRRYGENVEWARISETFAAKLEDSGDYHAAIRFWKQASRAFAKSKELVNARECSIRRAEAYLRLAEEAPSEMVKASFVRSAYEAYRQIGGTEEKRDALYRRLLEHQEKAVGEFGQISVPFEVHDMPLRAREAVSGRSLQQALYSLALLLTPSDPEELREAAEQSAQAALLQFMIRSERVNGLGRVVGVKPGGFEDPEGALRAAVHDHMNHGHQLDVAALINPARMRIQQDHPLTCPEDLGELNRPGFVGGSTL